MFEQISEKITSLQLNDKPGPHPSGRCLSENFPVRRRLGSGELVHRRSGGQSCNQTQCWAPGYRGTGVSSARGQDTTRDWLIIKWPRTKVREDHSSSDCPQCEASAQPAEALAQWRAGAKMRKERRTAHRKSKSVSKGQLQGPLILLKGGSCPEESVLGRAGGGAWRLFRERSALASLVCSPDPCLPVLPKGASLLISTLSTFSEPVHKHGFSLNKTTKKLFVWSISFNPDCVCKPARNVAGRRPFLRG